MNRINIICVGGHDMKRSLAFYKAIGFQTFEKGDQPPIVFFNNQGSKLELFSINDLAKDINEVNPPALSNDSFYGITLAVNSKSEAEVDEMFQLVIQAGGKMIKEPKHADWGGYSGYFTDPDGYYWELAFGPDWEFDDNEMLVIKYACFVQSNFNLAKMTF